MVFPSLRHWFLCHPQSLVGCANFFCPDFYNSSVDNFTMHLHFYWVQGFVLFCFVLVQEDLLKQMSLEELFVWERYSVLERVICFKEKWQNCLPLSAGIDQLRLTSFFSDMNSVFDCLFHHMVLDIILFHLNLIKWSDLQC